MTGVVLLLCACELRDTHPEEARALLELLQRLSPEGETKTRPAELRKLAALTLTHPDLEETRTRCLSAHTGLLEVQVLQGEARKHMAEATEAEGDARQASVSAAQAALDKAKETLVEARQEGDACQARTRQLTQRYR